MLGSNRRVFCTLHDVTLPTENGTTQIDHVVFSPYGVFVVETKNMSGAIYGQRWDEQWTQTFGLWRKHRFLNPRRQNEGHVHATREHLKIRADLVGSLVVFAGSAKFRTEMPGNVIQLLELGAYLKAYDVVRFSEDELEGFIARLERHDWRPAARSTGSTWDT